MRKLSLIIIIRYLGCKFGRRNRGTIEHIRPEKLKPHSGSWSIKLEEWRIWIIVMIECCYDPIIPFDYYIALSTRVIGVFMQSSCSIYLSFIFTHNLIIWIKFTYVSQCTKECNTKAKLLTSSVKLLHENQTTLISINLKCIWRDGINMKCVFVFMSL